jgi:hypothetical protein
MAGPQPSDVNHLAVAGEEAWRLAPHAHVIVHETRDGNEFITIYDCGAAQKPPAAQVIGNLVRVDADHDRIDQPTGYIAKLREEAVLVRQDDDHWVIRARGNPDGSSG